MSWLKELSFVDTTGAKKNHSFWKVSDPSDFLVGANAAFELLNFYQRYPEMKHSPLLYRITNDMNRSGLLSSESAKGFLAKLRHTYHSIQQTKLIIYPRNLKNNYLYHLRKKKDELPALKIYRKSFAQQR